MPTINPFYRFEDAIQNSSMSQGSKAISYATQELASSIGGLNSLIFGGAIGVIQNVVNVWNDLYSAINANWVIEVVEFTPSISAPYNAQVYIYDTNIITTYPLCRISVVFELDANQTVVNFKCSFLGYLNEYYSYAPYLLQGEKDAYEALVAYKQTGAAIFPKWYVFDKQTKVATSLLANFKNCKIDNATGFPVRETPDTEPRGNAPSIKLSPLDSDGKYIISLFEQLIEFAGKPGITFIDIENEWPKWVLPKNYLALSINDTTTANRLQIDVYKNDNTFGFVLLLRENNGFLFQRFYTTNYAQYDFLGNYNSTASLPYPPYNYSLKYFDAFYDYDFCDFQECAYPEKEIYQMPIKAGDFYQFNIPSNLSNTETDTDVSLGIFDKDFNLIQKIGEAAIPSVDCKCKFTWTAEYSEFAFNNLRLDINGNASTGGLTYYFGYAIGQVGSSEVLFSTSQLTPSNYLADEQDLINFLLALNTNDIFIDFDLVEGGGTLTISLLNEQPCEPELRICNYFSNPTDQPGLCNNYFIPGPGFDVNVVLTTDTCCLPTTQKQGRATIPSLKEGCYRFGLYKHESAIEGLQTIIPNQIISPTDNYVLAFVSGSGIAEYTVAIPTGVTNIVDIYSFLEANLPFGTVSYDGNNIELTITVYPYVPLIGWSIQIGTYDYGTGILTGLSCTLGTVPPLGDENINELYAFSNLLYFDSADCFSQILQYWQTTDSIAEGFEYYGDWFQQVRLGINGGGKKPVITESVYRQSNGVFRRPSNKQDLSIDLHTDFLDFETQSALVDATRHTNFVVNGQSLFVNGEIEVATIQDFTTQSSFEDLAQVKFSALIQGYQPKNSTCINC